MLGNLIEIQAYAVLDVVQGWTRTAATCWRLAGQLDDLDPALPMGRRDGWWGVKHGEI